VEVDFGGMQVSDVYPARIPDLFVGRPVILTGRFNGDGPATVTVKGKAGGETRTIEIAADLDAGAEHPGIASVWARKRIEVLANRMAYSGNPDVPAEIKQVALKYSLMSAYTAFVAVDSSRVTMGDHGVSVVVPVPVPEGVRYDRTVQD
jgi:Ca-activated chloride channel family protein